MQETSDFNPKQLFIRNLSYKSTKEDLEKLFQEVGPIKNVSVATENGESKGYGFVKFSLEEDAAAALEKFQGYALHGRRIKLNHGIKKERSEKPVKPEVNLPKPEPAKIRNNTEPTQSEVVETEKETNSSFPHVNRTRQILVFGVPVDINKKAFKIAMSKLNRRVEVDLIKEDHELSSLLQVISPAGKIMLLTAWSKEDAAALVAKLKHATVKNLGIRDHMEKKAEDVAHSKTEWLTARLLSDVTEVAERKRKCRLIIRNLSFQATEQNVADRLQLFGPLVEVELPRVVVDKNKKNRHFKAEKEQEEPEDGADAVPNQKLGPNQVIRPRGFAFVTFLCEKDASAAVQQSSVIKICSRDVAVDFCMSKDTYAKFGAAQEGEEGKAEGDVAMDVAPDAGDKKRKREDSEDLDGDSEDGDDGEMDEDGGDEDEDEDEDEGAGEESDDGDDEGAEKEEKGAKERKEDVGEGCTVFVRGLPFDADPSDLKRALGKFGKIALALIVKDTQTGVSKGSAFVKFSSPSEADHCLQHASENSGVVVKDRVCKVDKAVDRDEAKKLKSDPKGGKDKRNLYLLNEGMVKDSNLTEAEREKRKHAQTDKRKKLQNPLFFVSGTRLSFRNLSKSVTNKELKIHCLKALKSGSEKKLVTEQDLTKYNLAQGLPQTTENSSVPKVFQNCVKQCRIMMDLGRLKDGRPQSRGYGFVEFSHHAFALMCLREMNNNAKYSAIASDVHTEEGQKGRVMVEFSIENMRKLKIFKNRDENNRKHKESGRIAEEEGGGGSTAPPTKADGNKKKRKIEDKSSNSGKKADNSSAPSKKLKVSHDPPTAAAAAAAAKTPLNEESMDVMAEDGKSGVSKRAEKQAKRLLFKQKKKEKFAAKKASKQQEKEAKTKEATKRTWGGHKRIRQQKKANKKPVK